MVASDRLPSGAVSALLAGLVPIVAAHAAYLINLLTAHELAEAFRCMPYTEGCVSISRAARSGPGLAVFHWLMVPSALLLALSWISTRRWLLASSAATRRQSATVLLLGLTGAVFLVFYVTALGQEGDWYRWQRRYGVIFYFGGTALAQLLVVWVAWPRRLALGGGNLRRPIAVLMALTSALWALGVFSSVKRLLFADPDLIDRLENITEWWFALLMSLAFIALAAILRPRT